MTGVPPSNYRTHPMPWHLFYKTADGTFENLKAPLPAIIRGDYIIGKFEKGFLFPVYNAHKEMIVIHGKYFHQYIFLTAEAAKLKMDQPITESDTYNLRQPASASRSRYQPT